MTAGLILWLALMVYEQPAEIHPSDPDYRVYRYLLDQNYSEADARALSNWCH